MDFAKEFLAKLDGKINDNDLATVLRELESFASNYDIEKKQTELVEYSCNTPPCYNAYLVSKKIEGLSDQTLKAYDMCLTHFFRNISKPLELVTANDIRIYLYEYQKTRGISNRTLDGKRLILNTFLDWCRAEKYIQENPCEQIKPIKYERKEREPLTSIELELVRDACVTKRERAIIEVFYSTGCRVSELVNLKISDIDFQNGEVHLFGKGKKHRTSYLNAKAEVALKKYMWSERKGNSNAVFTGNRSPYNPLRKTSIEQIVRRIGERSGIERRVYPHLIRHTTATDALDRGMNVAEIQKILGHEKLDTTMIYAKICQDSVKYNHRKYIV